MISYEQFQRMQELKALGLSKAKTKQNLGLSDHAMNKWWHCTEKEFLNNLNGQEFQLDNYREFIISFLKTCPQIRDTNIEYKIKENFPDYSVKRSTFYRYMKKLREQTGYVSPFQKRKTSVRAELPPGYEAQVDFGQYKLQSMYGKMVRVYFFVMVLSYSRLKFVYFQAQPFTAQTAVLAHQLAFGYFGGRTQTVMYDQDRVFVVSENLGNIMFVPEFEKFVKNTGYSVVLCRPRDPQCKGKVEETVRYIKENFLLGRTYTGIDSLNSAALQWLDTYGNAEINLSTKKSPRELFRDESKYLIKVTLGGRELARVLTVTEDNYITYKDNRYEIPQDALLARCRVRVEEENGQLIIYRSSSNEVVYKHSVAEGFGQTVSAEKDNNKKYVSVSQAEEIFSYSQNIMRIIEEIKKGNPRYIDAQLRRLIRISNYYSEAQIENGAAYCIRTGIYTVFELSAYLVYKFGDEIGRKFLSDSQFSNYKKRAKVIKEEQDGRY